MAASRDVNVEMVASGGFLVGAALLLAGFLIELLRGSGLVPEGPLADLAAAYGQLVLVPPAFFAYAIAGILAPPAPFFAGASLGFLSSVVLTVLAILSLGAGGGAVDVEGLAPLYVFSIVAGAAVTGGIGWTIRRVTGRS